MSGVEYYVGKRAWTWSINGNRYIAKTKKEALAKYKEMKLKRVGEY